MRKLLVLFLLLAAPLGATTRYLSPTGSDSGTPCTASQTIGTPAKTFSVAIACMAAGDTLILRDGTYNSTNSGYIRITGKNGTASAYMTIRAENERLAYIQGDITGQPMTISTSSYWSFEGIRMENGDFNGQASATEVGSVIGANAISYCNFKRLLLRKNNRYTNSHLLSVTGSSTNCLFEENELYMFHRHGIRLSSGNYNVMRRNYANATGYADIVGGYSSNDSARGDSAFLVYPGSNNIMENNISEGVNSTTSVEALGTTVNNKFLGNIGINVAYGAIPSARNNAATITYMPRDTLFENWLIVNPISIGLYARGNKNTMVNNATFIGNGTASSKAIVTDIASDSPGDSLHSFYGTNIIATGFSGTGGMGFSFTTLEAGWGLNYPDSYNNTTASSPTYTTDAHITNELTTDPNLVSCYAWVPAASPMKGAGLAGADIGANILYEYVNGVITSTPLWNTSTNDFVGCGAIVSGVNDTTGGACSNVDIRLHIGTANGCAFPTGYGGASSSGGSWISLDNFDSYTPVNTDIDAGAGGSGWSANWVKTTGLLESKVAPSGGQGGLALSNSTNPTSDFDYYRTFANLSAGLAQFSFFLASNPTDDLKINLQDSTTIVAQVFLSSDGYLKAMNGAVKTAVEAVPFTLNAWNAVSIEFNDSTNPEAYRVRRNSGNWSQWFTVVSTTYTQVNRLRIYNTNGSGIGVPIYIDNIGEAYSGSLISTIEVIDSGLATQGLYIGTTKPLAWSSADLSGNVDLLVSRDSGLTYTPIASGISNSGSYNWTVTGPGSTHCHIKIRSSSNNTISDASAEFRIFGRYLR